MSLITLEAFHNLHLYECIAQYPQQKHISKPYQYQPEITDMLDHKLKKRENIKTKDVKIQAESSPSTREILLGP